jgi:hypothetical protein
MAERLTDEEIRFWTGDKFERVQTNVAQRSAHWMACEIRERRATDLTSEEVEALRDLSAQYRAELFDDTRPSFALAVLDKLTKAGPK